MMVRYKLMSLPVMAYPSLMNCSRYRRSIFTYESCLRSAFKILAIIIAENGVKVSKIKCFQFVQQTLIMALLTALSLLHRRKKAPEKKSRKPWFYWIIFNYSMIVATRPEPTVLPPSRYLNSVFQHIFYAFYGWNLHSFVDFTWSIFICMVSWHRFGTGILAPD